MDRKDLISSLPKGLVVAELGVFTGVFSKHIQRLMKPEKLYLVDIWTGSWDSGVEGVEGELHIPDMNKLYLELRREYEGSNVHVVKSDAASFVRSVDDLDCVYIDSSHLYDDTIDELNACDEKEITYVLGHDYDPDYQVKKAVDDWLRDNDNYELVLITDEEHCPSFYLKRKGGD